MLRIIAPILVVLFFSPVFAGESLNLNRDLKLLESNLLLLSDRIVLTGDELVTLEHIDTLLLEVKREIKDLTGDKAVYQAYLAKIENVRAKIISTQSGTEFNLNELSKEGLAKLKSWEEGIEEDRVNNKNYLYDTVACPSEYSLEEWRGLPLADRRMNAVRCSIERNKNEIYKFYTDYLDQNNEGVSGEILIVSSIDRDGYITIKHSNSDLPPDLVSVILEEFSNIKIPILNSNDTDFQYRLKFMP